MKITKAQKEAVISLLKEKIAEKQQQHRDAFIQEHRERINTEVNFYLKMQEEAENLINRLREIYKITYSPKKKDTLEGEICINGIYPGYNCHKEGNPLLFYKYSEKDLLKEVYIKSIDTPDYLKVERELELATLGKDFDLDAFLSKYLPK